VCDKHSDPRHSFSNNPGTESLAGAFSQWPQSLGFAALGDVNLVQRYADIARQEYLAAGIRVALHPQIDLATEPRWARIGMTFGEDADLTSRLVTAYIRGFQGTELGPTSVATMTKHFPGGDRRRTAKTRTLRTAASRSTPADRSNTTSNPSGPRSRPGRRR
jgi:beta-glucosidase